MKKIIPKISLMLLLPVNFAFAQQYTVKSIMDNIRKQVLNPLVSLFMVLATVIFIWGVIEYIIYSANEDKRTQGKKHIVWGLVGLTIMVAVWGIVKMLEYLICGQGGCPTTYTP